MRVNTRPGMMAVLTLLLSWSAWAPVRAAPLAILLTNDDGYAAPGIQALQQALVAAGHTVTIVAPRANQSGSSVRISTGAIAFEAEAERLWAVDGSPADAVAIGLTRIFETAPPDLVVSGANFGQNLGTTTNFSGTVGAAVMALHYGVPAIAVSVGMDLAEKNAEPKPYPSTYAAFAPAARFVVELIERLQTTADGAGLLPAGTLLNVNYPARAPADLEGVRVAALGRLGGVQFLYRATGTPGTVQFDIAAEPGVEPAPEQADTSLFARGYVTISILDGSWDAGVHHARFEKRLEGLTAAPASHELEPRP